MSWLLTQEHYIIACMFLWSHAGHTCCKLIDETSRTGDALPGGGSQRRCPKEGPEGGPTSGDQGRIWTGKWVGSRGRRCEGEAPKKGPGGGRGKINKNRVSSEFSPATKQTSN